MKTPFLIISILSALFLNAQQSEEKNTTCIDFDAYNACYSVEYRPRDEQVGTICSVKDLMMNGQVDVVSAFIALSTKGELLPISSRQANFDELEVLGKLKNLMSLLKPDSDYLLIINFDIRLNGKIEHYPAISIKPCEEK